MALLKALRTLRLLPFLCSPLFGALTIPPGIAAAESLSQESAIKATYLYKFAPFVEWPAAFAGAQQAPLNLCVGGDSALTKELAPAVTGQKDGQHPIAVRDANGSGQDCQILYIPGDDPQAARPLLASVKNKPVLTVTDLPQDSAVHGIVNFVGEKGHVRFDIDEAAASAAGLTISSKLLNLARHVRTRSNP